MTQLDDKQSDALRLAKIIVTFEKYNPGGVPASSCTPQNLKALADELVLMNLRLIDAQAAAIKAGASSAIEAGKSGPCDACDTVEECADAEKCLNPEREPPDCRTALELLVGLKKIKRAIEAGTATEQEAAVYRLTKEGAWAEAERALAIPSHEQRSDGWCPACKGSGTMKGMTSGHGPDDYEIDVECSTCGGTGAGTIPSSTRLRAPSVEPYVCMVVNDQPFPLGNLAMEPYEAVPAEIARQIARDLADAKDDCLRLHREKMDALFGPDGKPRSATRRIYEVATDEENHLLWARDYPFSRLDAPGANIVLESKHYTVISSGLHDDMVRTVVRPTDGTTP
jgi:hypothetical protein